MKKILYIVLALALSVSSQAQVDRSEQPKPGTSPKINLQKPQEFQLANGLKVLVVENHKLPRVNFSLVLDNPPSLEGNIKGVDELTSSMMGNGTSGMSKDEFNEKLDFYGASVSFSVNSIRGNSLSKYFPEILKMSAQGGLDPLFTDDELNSERAKLLDGIKAGEKSASIIANRVRAVLLYGRNHPRGEYLSEETINRVRLDDVREYYKKYFVPTNAYLVVVGDVKFNEVKKLVEENFSSWRKASAPKSIYSEPVNLSKTEINFVDVPNAVQSEISVSNIVDLKMTDPDYFAALLANHILGGGAEGYLFLNLREAHGWTYGSYSNISGDKYISDFSASAAVRNAVTDSAVVELLNEIKRIRTTLPTQEDLDLAKAKYIGSFVMNAEKPQTIASFALRQRTQSLPADFYENYIKNLNSVTLEQVQAAAKKYFSDSAARVVIASKASDVLPNLEKLGIPIKYFDRYGNETSKPEEKKVSADVNVFDILNKYIDAIGGKSTLETVKSVSFTYDAEMQGQKITMNRIITSEGKKLITMSMMGMTLMKNVFDGKSGYTEMQGKRKEMQDNDLEEALKFNTVFPELLMLKSTTLKLDGIDNINGSEAYRLVDGNNSYFYDLKTGLKISEGIQKEVAPGQTVSQMSNYSDYKDISGVKYPTIITMNVGMEIKLQATDIKVNEDIPDDTFK